MRRYLTEALCLLMVAAIFAAPIAAIIFIPMQMAALVSVAVFLLSYQIYLELRHRHDREEILRQQQEETLMIALAEIRSRLSQLEYQTRDKTEIAACACPREDARRVRT